MAVVDLDGQLALPIAGPELDRLPDRLRAKIAVRHETDVDGIDTPCWAWTAARNPAGYGMVWWDGRMVLAHRLVYELLVGPIPAGLTLDHLCRVRWCVNPSHLEAVTQRENVLRGTSPHVVAHVAGRCVAGLHDIVDDNVYRYPDGRRECRACKNTRARAWRARRAAAKGGGSDAT